MDLDTLVRLWPRLPVFRAVALTEHLPTAAKLLHITPPAISRAIRLLEEDLGQPLFRRAGRSITLNATGLRLRRALEQSMGHLQTALAHLSDDPLQGTVRISAIGVLTDELVLPALLDLQRRHPGFSPDLVLHGTREANDLLLRGRLDVAFYYEGHSDERLDIEHLGDIGAGVFCGVGHPLYPRRRVTMQQVLEYPFSIPQQGDTGRVMDGWPVEVPRKVGMRITTLQTNLRVSLSGRFVTVLPNVVARPFLKTKQLRRLPVSVVPPISVFGARRGSDDGQSAAARIIAAVREGVRREGQRSG